MTIAEAMERIDSAEFAGWRARFETDPWDETRADYRAGTIAAVIANVNRGRGGRTFSARDFFASIPDEPEQSGEEMARIFRAAASAGGN